MWLRALRLLQQVRVRLRALQRRVGVAASGADAVVDHEDLDVEVVEPVSAHSLAGSTTKRTWTTRKFAKRGTISKDKCEKHTRGAKQRRAYTVVFIRDVLRMAVDLGAKRAAGEKGVSEANIFRWRKHVGFYENEAGKYEAARVLGIKYRATKQLVYKQKQTACKVQKSLLLVIEKAVKEQLRRRRVVSTMFAKRSANHELTRHAAIGFAPLRHGKPVECVSRELARR